jgi:hypothetical protein
MIPTEETIEVGLPQLAAGIYFMKMISDNRTEVKKIIVE